MLVLAAAEYRPPATEFSGLELVIHAPLTDLMRPPTPLELANAWRASLDVADAVRAGRQVIVTCWEGRNRSALIVAFAMLQLSNDKPDEVIRRLRVLRADSLSNLWFVDEILRFALPFKGTEIRYAYGAPDP